MSDSGTYFFAVAATDGFVPTFEVGALPEQFGSVRALVVDGLVALVSTYTGPAIEDVPQNELTSCLLLHRKVIEELMRTTTVLPVRLGTVLEDDVAIGSLLRGSGNLLRTKWEHFRDSVEVDISATWNIDEILSEVAVDPEVSAAKSAAMTAPVELRSEAVLGVGRLVQNKLDERRSELEFKVLENLRPYANDLQLNSVVSDEIVCNIALLVDRGQTEDIDGALNRLDAELEGRINFQRLGPLPPYNFATVHVHGIDPEAIERSLALLELSGSFDESAIQDQYRALALIRHPDVRRADSNVGKDFEYLTWARSTLLSVCRNHPDTSLVPKTAVRFASVERAVGRN